MYAWKCWHDTRSRLALYASACLIVGMLAGINAVAELRWYGYWSEYINRTWDYLPWVWMSAIIILRPCTVIAAFWAALSFGATSVGAEYGAGTTDFLLTRPRSRKYFAWTGWSIAMVEITGVLVAGVIGSMPFLESTSGRGNWQTFGLLPGMLLIAAVVYGLTHFLAVVTRSGMKGLSSSVAVILFFTLLPTALDEWWHVKWPLRIQNWFSPIYDWLPGDRMHLTWSAVLVCALVALAFPLLSQMWMERRQV
jgi:ABC-type transport system involved in multi-copper enzyme maturation permease subunit